jgi:hypothetical protein
MMTFARVIKVQDGTINVFIDGARTTEPRIVNRVRLTIPKPPETGVMKTYSVLWVAPPLCFGLYCIYCGEREYWKKSKKDKA